MPAASNTVRADNSKAIVDDSRLSIPLLSKFLPQRFHSTVAIWFIAFEFGLAIIAIRTYKIVSPEFLRLCILAFFGFLIHAHLPQRLRLNFFVALSAAAIAYTIGTVNAVLLFALGIALIGMCHLPIAYLWRVMLIIVSAGVLMAVRGFMPFTEVGGVVVPVLASMFMFRLIIYLFDVRHEKPGVPLSWRFSYFFMLPNVCFPLFPLVDYKQFKATYYDQHPHDIYQRGIKWIFRGIYHLLLYRLVYLHLTVDPAIVQGSAQFIQYSVTSFLLYLRVSGTFHLAIGLMLLFGFNLPDTHRLYFLASSFTDFWRRINIYWKDFMRRIVFNTTNFYMRRFGSRLSVALSTAIVFLATWVLHSYQWFWLQGSWLLAAHDALFWGLLGALFIFNFLFEEKFGAAPVLGGNVRWTARTFGALVLRTTATFILMALLWGLWSSESYSQWREMLSTTGVLWLAIGIFVLSLYTASFALGRSGAPTTRQRIAVPKQSVQPFWRAMALTTSGFCIIIAVGDIHVYSKFNDNYASVVDSLKTSQLNARDQRALEQGYYEQLLSVNITSGLWDIYAQGRKERIQETVAWRPTSDLLEGELVPGSNIQFKGVALTVNRWGMRDKDYALAKPANTARVAVLGASHVMGSGVADNETFVELIEDRANREQMLRAQTVEVLNFAVAGYSPLQYLYLLETTVGEFSPDYVVVVAHPQDNRMLLRSISQIISQGGEIQYNAISDVLKIADITAETPRNVIERRLQPHVDKIKDWVYRSIADRTRLLGACPIFVLMPTIGDVMKDEGVEQTLVSMQGHGFHVLHIMDVYNGVAPESLQVAEWDTHPNKLGHRLVADRLYPELKELLVLLCK